MEELEEGRMGDGANCDGRVVEEGMWRVEDGGQWFEEKESFGVRERFLARGRGWCLGVMEAGMLRIGGVALSTPGCRKARRVGCLARAGSMSAIYAVRLSCGVGAGVLDFRGSLRRE